MDFNDFIFSDESENIIERATEIKPVAKKKKLKAFNQNKISWMENLKRLKKSFPKSRSIIMLNKKSYVFEIELMSFLSLNEAWNFRRWIDAHAKKMPGLTHKLSSQKDRMIWLKYKLDSHLKRTRLIALSMLSKTSFRKTELLKKIKSEFDC